TDALSMIAPPASGSADVARWRDGVALHDALSVFVDAPDDFLERLLNEELIATHEADRGVRVRLDRFDQVRVDGSELATHSSNADHAVSSCPDGRFGRTVVVISASPPRRVRARRARACRSASLRGKFGSRCGS